MILFLASTLFRLVLIALFGLIIGWFAWKDLPPLARASAITATAAGLILLIVTILTGWWSVAALGGQLRISALPALIFWALYYWHLKRHWTDNDAGEVFR